MTASAEFVRDPAFWTAVLTLSTPLVLGVMGALLCARAGVLDFGIGGAFVIGALVGMALLQRHTGPWTILVAVMGAGLSYGLLQGMLTGPLAISQHFAGLALTLLGTGIAQFEWPSGPPHMAAFRLFDITFLNRVPAVGDALVQQSSPMLLAVLISLVVAYVLNRTPLGLALRACGENPFAVEAQGRSVHGLRMGALMAGSALMTLGGAAISLMATDPIGIEHVAGRGILCLALAAAGGWRPGLAFVAALLFGANDAAAPYLQQDFNVRAPIMAVMPYLLAIVALTATRRRLRWPATLSTPYFKRRAL
jgi:simple sugar transport system permease protein